MAQAMSDYDELTLIFNRLSREHDMLPFMTGLHPVGTLGFRPLPHEMRVLLEATPDYQSPAPGQGPVWLMIASADDSAELVVYRTRDTCTLYVIAPGREVSQLNGIGS